MSSASPTLAERLTGETVPGGSVDLELSPAVAATLRTAYAPVRFVGFWLAVALPFCYLPLLSGGLPMAEVETFATLLALNVAGLVLGRGYGRTPDRD